MKETIKEINKSQVGNNNYYSHNDTKTLKVLLETIREQNKTIRELRAVISKLTSADIGR